MNIPEVKENIDWSTVIAKAKEHVERVLNKEGVRSDDDHHIFEAVISAMYGKGIWAKYNEAME